MGKRWTNEEVRKLEKMIDQGVPIYKISKQLGRTKSAIVSKLTKENIKCSENGERVTLSYLLDTMYGGSSGDRYRKFLNDKDLNIISESFYGNKKSVKLSNFWKWAEKHKDEIDFTRIEPWALGKEPKWVAAERKKTKEEIRLRSKYRLWSEYETAKLDNLLQQGKTCKEIAVILRRTAQSVEGKSYRLLHKKKQKQLEQMSKGA